MSELRQNLITRDWVIIAHERSQRPNQFAKKIERDRIIPPYQAGCPFCPGNEHDTAEEICCLGERENWKVRAVFNKYPAVSPEKEPTRKIQKTYRSIAGFGVHEVIIEHRLHNVNPALLAISEIANIFTMYRERYRQLKRDPRIKTIVIFKNHGPKAGTSLEHPHSQIAATPIVPGQMRDRISEAMRFFDETGECLYCRTMKDELSASQRIISENKHFVAFIPYAALSPFHLWIFPKRHTSSFEQISDEEIIDMSRILKTVLAKLYYGLNNPDYNYTIRSIPTDQDYTDYYHWYLAIIPRVSQAAGFELGSGMFINTSLPEESAEFLRSIEIPISSGNRDLDQNSPPYSV
jgi:UDPglucose--hexose-1-phosphate uridylyltransferase